MKIMSSVRVSSPLSFFSFIGCFGFALSLVLFFLFFSFYFHVFGDEYCVIRSLSIFYDGEDDDEFEDEYE